MTSMLTVRQAVIERLVGAPDVPDFEFYWEWPDEPELPACVLEPARPFMNPNIAFGGLSADWNLDLTLIADRVDEQDAQELLSGLCDTEGPIAEALRSDDYTDTLADLGNWAQVMYGSDMAVRQINGTSRFYMGLRVLIKA